MFQGRDLVNNLGATQEKATGQVIASGAGTILDLQTLDVTALLFVIHISAVAAADASNYLTFGMEEGDNSSLTDTATPESDRIIAPVSVALDSSVPPKPVLSTVDAVINATSQAGTVLRLGFVAGKKRYCRLKWTETGTFDGTFSVVAITNPKHMGGNPVGGYAV